MSSVLIEGAVSWPDGRCWRSCGLPARVAHAGAAYTVSKPKLSAAPVVDVPFTVSGTVRPKATAESRTVVKIKLYALTGGRWAVDGHLPRQARRRCVGYDVLAAARRLRGGRVRRQGVPLPRRQARRRASALTSFDVARRITIDSIVNGWMAPSLGDTMVARGHAAGRRLHHPADWASDDPAKR